MPKVSADFSSAGFPGAGGSSSQPRLRNQAPSEIATEIPSTTARERRSSEHGFES
jgi:hypothetical protein